MAPTLNQRRRVELSAKVGSLVAELDHWKDLTEKEALGLRRHHSQVRRLAAVLEGLTEHGRANLEALSVTGTAALDQGVALENDILAAHAIWEVFRAKLVLRQDGMFRNVLAACDDLSWECYAPAMQRFAPGRKGPPLVYFTATWSPFMVPRDSSFQNEVRAGPGAAGALRDDAFLEVLKRLPIPLVSVPWYHVFHLPGALVIAHEIGHVVETDFDLTADIAVGLSAAGLDHEPSWRSWAAEAFADQYGCLSMGPAFVGAMMDLLATTVTSVQGDTRFGGKYPTRALRVELMLEALRQTGHETEAARLRATWEAAYGAMQTMLDFRADVKKVVAAIHAGPYKGTALTDIIRFPTDKAAKIEAIAEAVGAGTPEFLRDNQDKDYTDPRLLFAGAQWLHEHPQPLQDVNAYQFIVDQIIKKGAAAYRGPDGAPVADRAALEADLSASEKRDRADGRALRTLLDAGSKPAGPQPD